MQLPLLPLRPVVPHLLAIVDLFCGLLLLACLAFSPAARLSIYVAEAAALAGASEPTISAGFIPRLVRLMHCATDRAAEPGPWLLPEGCRAIARTTGLPRSRHRTRGEAGGGARGGRNLAQRDRDFDISMGPQSGILTFRWAILNIGNPSLF